MSHRSGHSVVRWLTLAGAVVAGGVLVWLVLGWVSGEVVTVTEVVRGPVVEAFYATGTLAPDREYPIKSNVEGTVTAMLVDKGVEVAKGEKLAFVRVEEYELEFSKAGAELDLKKKLLAEGASPLLGEFDSKLKAASEQLDVAKRELERVQGLRATGAATQSDHDRALDRVQTHWSLVESIKAQKATTKLELERDVAVTEVALGIARWNVDQQTIRSPVEGVVLDRPVSVGTRVKINDPLMEIADVRPEKLVMRAAVDEEDKTRLSEGQRVDLTLYSYPGRVFEGTVKRVYPRADPERRTFEVDVTVRPVDGGFSAGMTGELAFVVQSKPVAMVVPSQAVQKGQVWAVREGKLTRVEAKLGLRSVERTEILEGVGEGESVVVSPVDGLREGQRVRTRYMDPSEAAGLNKPAEDTAFKGFR